MNNMIRFIYLTLIKLNSKLKGNEDMTFEEGLDMLKETFDDYMQTTVLNHVKVDDFKVELGKKTLKILKQIHDNLFIKKYSSSGYQ